MRNVLIIVLCVFLSSFFIVEKKNKNKKSLSQLLKFEIHKIDLKEKHNFFQFYVDAIFKSDDLIKSLNENDLKVEKSNFIIFKPKLTEIDEVEIEEDINEPSFSKSENTIDFQNFSEQKPLPNLPLEEKTDILEEVVEFVETERSSSDIVKNEMTLIDIADIQPSVNNDEKQVYSKEDISEEVETKELIVEEVVNKEQETPTPKKSHIVNPPKTLNEAIYFYTFEGNNAPEFKKGVSEDILEYLLIEYIKNLIILMCLSQ